MTLPAMVLAAGRGERMRPLSDVLPKPALPLPGGPLVATALRLAVGTGAGRIAVNTWHLAHHLERTVEGIDLGSATVVLSPERHLMGGAGGLALARDRGLLGSSGPVLVLNGDIVARLDLAPVLAAHDRGAHLVTMALLRHPDPKRWSRVEMCDPGVVERILPPGPDTPQRASWLYPGFMIVARSALDALPSTPGGIMEHLWQPALDAGRLGGVEVHGSWREVGTPAAYLDAVVAQLGGRNVVHEHASLSETASVQGAMIDGDAVIGPGAHVHASVLAEGAHVGADAVVDGSVLLGRVRIGANTIVRGQFLAIP